MKKIIVGAAMLIFPAGYVFWLLADRLGVWKTIGVFALTIVWTSIAVDLLYEGFKRLKGRWKNI